MVEKEADMNRINWSRRLDGSPIRFSSVGEEHFLKTIDAQPGQPTPHLVYADWLEEQGRTDEAEFRKWVGKHNLHPLEVQKEPDGQYVWSDLAIRLGMDRHHWDVPVAFRTPRTFDRPQPDQHLSPNHRFTYPKTRRQAYKDLFEAWMKTKRTRKPDTDPFDVENLPRLKRFGPLVRLAANDYSGLRLSGTMPPGGPFKPLAKTRPSTSPPTPVAPVQPTQPQPPDPFHQAYQNRFGTQPPQPYAPVMPTQEQDDLANETNALYTGQQARQGPISPSPIPGQPRPFKPSVKAPQAQQRPTGPKGPTGLKKLTTRAVKGAKQAVGAMGSYLADPTTGNERLAGLANQVTGQPHHGQPGWLSKLADHIKQLGTNVATANRPALGGVPEGGYGQPKPMTPQPPKRSWGLKRVGKVVRFSMMNDELFQARLKAEPTNLNHHLLYADWLEEHGRTDEALAHKWIGGFFGHHPQVGVKPNKDGVWELLSRGHEFPSALRNHIRDAWYDPSINPRAIKTIGERGGLDRPDIGSPSDIAFAYRRLGSALRKVASAEMPEGFVKGIHDTPTMPPTHPNVPLNRLVRAEVHRLAREFNRAALTS